MTGIELVRDVCRQHGIAINDDEAGYVLWEYTGFPSFYEGTSAEEYFRKQLNKWAAETIDSGRP